MASLRFPCESPESGTNRIQAKGDPGGKRPARAADLKKGGRDYRALRLVGAAGPAVPHGWRNRRPNIYTGTVTIPLGRRGVKQP